MWGDSFIFSIRLRQTTDVVVNQESRGYLLWKELLRARWFLMVWLKFGTRKKRPDCANVKFIKVMPFVVN